jgi:hypothetical protein
MTNLGIRSTFQSLFSPYLEGIVSLGLNIFHKFDKFKEAESEP